jgi:cardiolipin synthase
VAWVGGHNVGDEYMGRDPKVGEWRDTHVRIEGPAALGAQLAFIEDWRWATDVLLEGLSWEPQVVDDGDAHGLIIASGPADTLETATLMFIQAINAATSRIWIASPYFVPDEATTRALQLAALRGVDVRILIPEKSDNPLVTLAAYSYFDDVESVGAQVYRYGAGFLHGKYVLLDDTVSMIGTANFDNRSFRLNFEITAAIIDRAFATEVEQMFEADFARSRLMLAGEYDEKPAWFRLAVRLSRLAAPVL